MSCPGASVFMQILDFLDFAFMNMYSVSLESPDEYTMPSLAFRSRPTLYRVCRTLCGLPLLYIFSLIVYQPLIPTLPSPNHVYIQVGCLYGHLWGSSNERVSQASQHLGTCLSLLLWLSFSTHSLLLDLTEVEKYCTWPQAKPGILFHVLIKPHASLSRRLPHCVILSSLRMSIWLRPESSNSLLFPWW